MILPALTGEDFHKRGSKMKGHCSISVDELVKLIGLPARVAIIDARTDEDFADDARLIPGAFRHPFERILDLVPEINGQQVIVYCQKGKKISQGAAALLRDAGVMSLYLDGGQFAWRDRGGVMIPASKLPPRSIDGRTVWVTRERPKIDRLACPWLIRRFIDPKALFLFVETAEVMNVADRFTATPFDIEGAFFSHRGEACSFDTILEEFGLAKLVGLAHLAPIVRGADTNRHDLAPQAAGLLALSLGLAASYDSDLDQLAAALPLYDALYRWARDAADQGHDWNPQQQ